MEIKTLYHTKRTYAPGRKIDYIVIHYTAGTTSKKGTAYNTAEYFRISNIEGSADYIVDDETVYCCNSDIKNFYSWAVGGSKYTSMTTSEGGKYYGKCTNKNSISIEICSNKENKNSLLATDTDWYFTDKALNLAAELTRKLMTDFGIPIERVIMHHHVTGKVCPNSFCVNESRLKEWENFKNLIQEEEEMVEKITVNINGKDYKADKILKEDKNYICVQDLAQVGFKIGYNNKTKVPSIANEPKKLPLTVDGEETSVEAVNINGNNYVPIRGLAGATGAFEVDYKDGNVVVKTK